MKTKLLLISEETILERMFALQKNITDSVQDEEKKQFYIGQYASLDLVLSLSKPLVIPSDEELKIISQHEIMFNSQKREWWVDGCKFIIDKINSQLENIK